MSYRPVATQPIEEILSKLLVAMLNPSLVFLLRPGGNSMLCAMNWHPLAHFTVLITHVLKKDKSTYIYVYIQKRQICFANHNGRLEGTAQRYGINAVVHILCSLHHKCVCHLARYRSP